MKAIPPLPLGAGVRGLYPTPPSSAASSSRKSGPKSAQAGGSLALSARHIVKPQVGMSAMLSALGGVKPAWENYPQQLQMTPRTTRDGMPGLPEPPMPDNRPYHVGRQRARGQLRTALETRNESAQLRRLEHALLTRAVHDDYEISREVERAADVAFNLSQRLRGTVDDSSIMWNEDVAASEAKVPAARPSVGRAAAAAGPHEAAQAEEEGEGAEEEGDEAAESHAAVKIQSMYRGRMEREQLRRHAAEEEAAALRIQSAYRGNVSRARGGT